MNCSFTVVLEIIILEYVRLVEVCFGKEQSFFFIVLPISELVVLLYVIINFINFKFYLLNSFF